MLASGLVPSLPVDVIDRKGDQRDGGDLSDLRVGELVKSADSLDNPFHRGVVRILARTSEASPLAHWSLSLSCLATALFLAGDAYFPTE